MSVTPFNAAHNWLSLLSSTAPPYFFIQSLGLPSHDAPAYACQPQRATMEHTRIYAGPPFPVGLAQGASDRPNLAPLSLELTDEGTSNPVMSVRRVAV